MMKTNKYHIKILNKIRIQLKKMIFKRPNFKNYELLIFNKILKKKIITKLRMKMKMR